MSRYLDIQIYKCHDNEMSRYYKIQILKCLDIACDYLQLLATGLPT